MFAEHAANAVKVERSPHEGVFRHWGLAAGEVFATPPESVVQRVRRGAAPNTLDSRNDRSRMRPTVN
jgi:hypothetical protein